jgi:glycosyltransferase involved in cell wall biosynthesis
LFRRGIKSQGLKLLVVEANINNSGFELKKNDADLLVKVKANSFLYHRSQLYNVALKHLPKNCDKIIFVDCDVQFLDANWASKTEKALEEYSFVQPFSKLIRAPKLESKKIAGFVDLIKKNISLFGKATDLDKLGCVVSNSLAFNLINFGKFSENPIYGSPGIAFAVRRNIIENGFFPFVPFGSDDLFFWATILDLKDPSLLVGEISQAHKIEWLSWKKKLSQNFFKSFSFVEGNVIHFWHGEQQKRKHQNRGEFFVENNFNPQKDCEFNKDGLIEWKNKKFNEHLKKYFAERKED